MNDAEQGHPDEGTIHAWLDGALDDGAARTLEAHVAACPHCAERVAEARGLIAGASRIVGALDDVPSASGPAWGQAPVAPAVAPRGARLLRATPARAAIAATLLVALGVSLTYKRTAVDSSVVRVATEQVAPSPAAPAMAAAPMAAPAEAPRRDPLLDSAIARNVAKALPPRTVEPAPGPAIPVAPPVAVASVPDTTASARVAAGRSAARADREVANSAAPDQLAGRVSAATARAADDRAVATAMKADAAPLSMQRAAGAVAPKSIIQSLPRPDPTECYRVETANGTAATWGADALPLVVRVDSAGHALVLDAAGRPTGSQAIATRAGEDSLLLRLRRLGYEGTLALGAPGDARAGVMRSRPLTAQLDEVVAAAPPVEPRATARKRVAPVPKQAAPAATPAPSAEERAAATAAPAIPVVARRIGCSGG